MRIKYTVIFFLNKRFVKDGKQKIYGRIFYKRKKSEFATNLWLEPKKWNHELQSAIKSPIITKKLNQIRVEIDEIVDRLKYEKKHIDAKTIKDYFLGNDVFDIGVIEYLNRIIRQKESQLHLSRTTPEKYKQLAGKLMNYIRITFRITDVDIKKIDYSFVLGFDRFLKSLHSKQFNKPLSATTINKIHGFFRTVLNQAYDEDYIRAKPYKRFKFDKVESKIRYLTSEELKKLESVDLSQDEKLDRARDIFLFSVYTGLRYGDNQRLTLKHLKTINGVLFYSIEAQEKTQNPVENPLYPKAKNLIDKYAESAERLIENRLMPVMGNTILNKRLKKVALKAGIHQPLYHHMARHTCATTVLLESGASLDMVKEFLGHTNIKSTMIYAKVTSQRKIRLMEQIAGFWED